MPSKREPESKSSRQPPKLSEALPYLHDTINLTDPSALLLRLEALAGGVSPACERTHAKLVIGTCPWCGFSVRNGVSLGETLEEMVKSLRLLHPPDGPKKS